MNARRKVPKASIASDVHAFADIPNVGPATAADFAALGLAHPTELVGQDPFALYDRLCVLTRCRQDPCVADVFIAAIRFMEGSPPHSWWHYTAERKRLLAERGRPPIAGAVSGSGAMLRRAAPGSSLR